MSLRVTHRSLFTSNLANLQTNLSRIQRTQDQMSSGKLIQTASDDPGGTGSALRQRAEIKRNDQLARNADDGIGWLNSADSALGDMSSTMGRVRELLVQANSTATLNPVTADAIAVEIETLREHMIGLANTNYLGRPIFGGTTTSPTAYAPDGTFLGDNNAVERAVRPGVTVQINMAADAVFGAPGADVFGFLDGVVDHLRNDWTQLDTDLGDIDGHLDNMWRARSQVGARYSQVEAMRDRTESDILLLRERLSEIEDIDLPATIVDLQLQETAYQAALSATARSVQPSLLDFLR